MKGEIEANESMLPSNRDREISDNKQQKRRDTYKKLNTLNPRKMKEKPRVVGNKGMVDIDNVHYTEYSSNANSVNKSEIINQMVEKYDGGNTVRQ
jgi:hypothetical protein